MILLKKLKSTLFLFFTLFLFLLYSSSSPFHSPFSLSSTSCHSLPLLSFSSRKRRIYFPSLPIFLPPSPFPPLPLFFSFPFPLSLFLLLAFPLSFTSFRFFNLSFFSFPTIPFPVLPSPPSFGHLYLFLISISSRAWYFFLAYYSFNSSPLFPPFFNY